MRETTRAHGATVAVNRVLDEGRSVVTVVGEIPLATASRVAENVAVLEGRP
ncbi:MAG: MucB/RseB C-terminal domain-containing protein [Gammaproteobacteria bacterium]